MSQIVTMSNAELERLIEARFRAQHDAQNGNSGTPPAANTRAGGNDGSEPEFSNIEPSDVRPNSGFRGHIFGEQRKSKLTPDQARGIMSFMRGVVNHDREEQKRAWAALGERGTFGGERLQSQGVSADGGTTLPSLFSAEVLIDLPNVTPFADSNIVRIIPMEGETLRWTKVTTRPAQPPHVSEGAQYSKSGVTFAPITLVAKKIGEIIPFTEEILASNAIGMVQVISSLVADAFAFKYNSLVTNGNGDANEPEGVLTNGNIIGTPVILTDDRTKADSLITVYHSLKSQYRKLSSIWLFNDLDIAIIRKLKDTLGRYLWVDGFNSRPDTLLGRPVIENPDLPQGTFLFGNFIRGYVIGRREGMTMDVNSSGTDWEKDIRNYKFRERWDGRVHDEKAFVKGTGLA